MLMNKPMSAYTEVAKRLEDSLDTICSLGVILIENGSAKAAGDPACPPQIDCCGEEALLMSIKLLAAAAHRDFCQLATDLGIPE